MGRKNKFDATEDFEFDEIPSDFSPITTEELDDIKERCLKFVDDQFEHDYQVSATKPMLGSIGGEFDEQYAILEGAYNSRRVQLVNAYHEAIQQAEENLLRLEKAVKEHTLLYNEYVKIHMQRTGEQLSAHLDIDKGQIETLRKQIEQLKHNLKGEE